MGHIRLGRIPKTKQWNKLFQLLAAPGIDAAQVARAIAIASQKTILSSTANPAAHYCFWLLTRLATAAKSQDFRGELAKIGIRVDNAKSGMDILAAVADVSAKEVRRRGTGNVLDQIAELSLRDTLSHHVAANSQGLFGCGVEDVQSALRELSTQRAFGKVASDYFAHFLGRSIKLVADKEISNHVGVGKPLASPAAALQFERDVERYSSESSRIVEDFAGGWFSKHNWQQRGEISEAETSAFVSYAFQKLEMDLQKGQE